MLPLLLLACADPPDESKSSPDADADTACAVQGYADLDADGFGDPAAPVVGCAGDAIASDATDCDDTDPAAFPGAPEVFRDGVDQDCDGADAHCAEDRPPHVGDVWLDDGDAAAVCAAGIGSIDGDLWIRYRSTPDLSGLECLCEVTGELRVMNGALGSLRGLEGLSHVGFLHVSNEPELVSLDGLDGLLSIGTVQVTGNDRLADLGALAGVTGRVEELTLGGDALRDLRGLEGIVETDRLYVAGSPTLRSLDGLDGLETVGALHLEDLPELADVAALSGVVALDGLALVDLPALAAVDRLSRVQAIGSMQVEGLDALVSLDLPALTSLGDVRVVGNAALVAAPALAAVEPGADRSVRLQDNPSLVDVPPLSRVDTLSVLQLQGNALVSLTPFEALRTASSLTVDEAGVADLGPLGGVTALDTLEISGTAVSSLDGLRLDAVGTLTLNGNVALVDLRALAGTRLGSVYVGENDALADLAGLGNVVGGAYADLRFVGNDALTALDGVGGSGTFRLVQVEDNAALVDVSALHGGVGAVEQVDIEGNPRLPTADAQAVCDAFAVRTEWCTVRDNAP